jgi:prolyl-tRNA synthetase
MSGAMGGSKSEEFLAYCPDGEDTFVQCAGCGFAANVEAVQTQVPPHGEVSASPALQIADTPNTPTIETLVDLFNARTDLQRKDRTWTAADTLKNVVFKVISPTGERSLLAVGVPGDREVDLKRLEAAIHPLEAEILSDEDFLKNPELVKGYIGPTILGEKSASGIRYLVDPRVVNGSLWISGANESGKHAYNLMMGRDFFADGTIEAADVRDGDACPTCNTGVLRAQRGIEIGHIFQLGRKYAQALELSVLDEQGKRVTPTMGSYGIGVSRLVAVVAEQSHDEKGLIWPREIAPADVHLVVAGKDEEIFVAADALSDQLERIGIEVLIDDRRGVSVGVKFNDAELLGIPSTIIVGKKLDTGEIEVKNRRTSEVTVVSINDIDKLRDLILNA